MQTKTIPHNSDNEIPPITEPIGRHWDQPDRSRILVDNECAMMDRKTFEALSEYSASMPSGVYEGKMWRRHDGIFDQEFLAKGGKPSWLLVWFGRSNKPGMVSVNSRPIVIV
jgi:hypothetical protein